MAVDINKDTIQMVVKSLKTNRFEPVEFVKDVDTATKVVLDMIPLDATVGVVGSTSVRQSGVIPRLISRGTIGITVTGGSAPNMDELRRRAMCSDILLTSSNAITLDGKLVNIDGIGNRVASMIYGPKRVILVVGINKLVRDVDEAIKRIKNVIAPYHAMTIGYKTPCAKTGHCSDCSSPDRICNITTIIEKKPRSIDIAIVLVGEDMGLGWDPDWPEERKEKIASVYRETRKNYAQPASRFPVEKSLS